MKILPRIALATVLLLSVSANADVSRHPVKLAELPPAVRKTALRQKQRATIRRLEKTVAEGQEIYEMELQSGIVSRTVLIDAAGQVLEIKQLIKLSALPPAAKTVIESSVGDGTILTLQSVKSPSGIIAAYEVKFRKNDKESQLRIAPDGRLVQE
jgi:hypothetical protein